MRKFIIVGWMVFMGCLAIAETPPAGSQNDFLDALNLHESGASYEKVMPAYDQVIRNTTNLQEITVIQMARLCYLQKNSGAMNSKFLEWAQKEEKKLESFANRQTWFQALYHISLTRLKLSHHPMWAEILKDPSHPLIAPEFKSMIDEEIQDIRNPERILSGIHLPQDVQNSGFYLEDLILLDWYYFYLLYSQNILTRIGTGVSHLHTQMLHDIEHKFFQLMKAYASQKNTFNGAQQALDAPSTSIPNNLFNIEVKIPKGKSVEQYVQEIFGPKAWEMFDEKIEEMNPQTPVITPLEEEKSVQLPLKLWTLFPVKTEVEQIEEEAKKVDEEKAVEEQSVLPEETKAVIPLEEASDDAVVLEDEKVEENNDAAKEEASENEKEKTPEETVKDSFQKSSLETQPEHATELSQMMEQMFGEQGQDILYAMYSPAYTPLYLRTFVEVRATPHGIITEPDLSPDPVLDGDPSSVVDIQQVTGQGNSIVLIPSEGVFKSFLMDGTIRPSFNPANQSYLYNALGLKDSDGMVTYQAYGRGILKANEALDTYEKELIKNSVYFDTGGLTKSDVPQLLRTKIEALFSDPKRSDEDKLATLAHIVSGIIEYDKKLNERPRVVKESKSTGVHAHRLFLQRLQMEEGSNGGIVLKQKPFGVCDSYAEIFVQFVRLFAQGDLKFPSRVAIGFMAQKGVVLVSQAHAWAEIYIHDKGWVRFEPTGSQRGGLGRGGNELTDSLRGDAPLDSLLDDPGNLDFDMIQPPREDGDGESEFGGGSGWGWGSGGGGGGGNHQPNPEEEKRRQEAKKFIDEELPTHTWQDVRSSSALQQRIREVSKYYAWETQRALLEISLGEATDWEDLLFWSLSFLLEFRSQRQVLSSSTLDEWVFNRTQEYIEGMNQERWARLLNRLEGDRKFVSVGRGVVLYKNLLLEIPESKKVHAFPQPFFALYIELLMRFENSARPSAPANEEMNDGLSGFYRTLLFFSKNRLIKKQPFLDHAEKLIQLDMILNQQKMYGNAGAILDVYYQNAGDRMIHFLTTPVQMGDERLPLFYDSSTTRYLNYIETTPFRSMAQIVQNDYLTHWNQRPLTKVNLYQEVLALNFLFTLDDQDFVSSKRHVNPELYLPRFDLLNRIITHQALLHDDNLGNGYINDTLQTFDPQLLSDDIPIEKMQPYKNGVFLILGIFPKDAIYSFKQIILLQKLIQVAKKYSNLQLFSSIEVLGQWLKQESLRIQMPVEAVAQEATVHALAEISAYYLQHSENKTTEWSNWFMQFQKQNPNISGAAMLRDVMGHLPLNDRRRMTELLWQEVKKEAEAGK